ncbi:hypothetical protein [Zobellella taiwanensis]
MEPYVGAQAARLHSAQPHPRKRRPQVAAARQEYRALGLPIHLIGVEFSREQRQVVAFEMETIEVRANSTPTT